MNENKRMKVAIGAAGFALLCGIIKSFAKGFPIIEVFAFVGPVTVYYFTVQTVTDNAKIKSTPQVPCV